MNDNGSNNPLNNIQPVISTNDNPVSEPISNIQPGVPSNDNPVSEPVNNIQPGVPSNDNPVSEPISNIQPGVPSNDSPVSEPANNIQPGVPSNDNPVSEPVNNIQPGVPSNDSSNKKKFNPILIIVFIVIVAIIGITLFFNKDKNTVNSNEVSNQMKTAQQRKQESIAKIKNEGISYLESLPVINDSSQISLRSKKEILARAIVSYAVANVAIDYNWHKEDLEESRNTFETVIHNFNIDDKLTEEEKMVLYGEPTEKIALDTEWTIEASKVLFWALGFIDDLNYPSEDNVTNANELTNIIVKYKTFDEFLNAAKLINVETILDYTDLYYRYHWACEEDRINSNASVGNLSSDIVYERRRAFEWMIDSQSEWYRFNANT